MVNTPRTLDVKLVSPDLDALQKFVTLSMSDAFAEGVEATKAVFNDFVDPDTMDEVVVDNPYASPEDE